MAENSKIEWCDSTFNPWIGCTKVGPGCDNCYAEDMMARRYGRVQWGAGQARSRTSPANWRKPLAWNRAAESGPRPRVFCASLADVFDNDVPPAWRVHLFDLIAATPNLDWLLLTKRIGNVEKMIGDELPSNVWLGATVVNQEEADRDIPKLLETPARVRFLSCEPLLGPINVRGYLMQGDRPGDCARCGVGHGFTRCPNYGGVAPVREPRRVGDPGCPSFQRKDFAIGWVIVGGESGPGARPMRPDWARSLRDQCAAAGVPFFFKQHGDWIDYRQTGASRWCNRSRGNGPLRGSLSRGIEDLFDGQAFASRSQLFDGQASDGAMFVRLGKKRAGRELDGRTHDGYPGEDV